MSELKCCPFCGGEAEFVKMGIAKDIPLGFVRCTECEIRLRQGNCTEDFARDEWNHRTPMDNIVEKLEEAEKKGSELIGKPHMDSHVLFGWGCAMKTAIEIVREEGAKNDRS